MMKTRRLILVTILLVFSAVWISFAVQRRERRAIDAAVFAEMRKNPWDLNGDLLWGYFFTNQNKKALEFDAWVLRRFGYRTVDMHQDEKKGFWWLHVEKVERHTLDSMAGRNVRLAWFGSVFGGSDYDGWDVGQVGFRTEANQALVPTPMSVTSPAEQARVPATGAAHL
jgi:hypothetical protein